MGKHITIGRNCPVKYSIYGNNRITRNKMSENEALAPKDYEHWPTKSQERFNELQNPKCKKTANEIWIDERSPEELTRTLGVIKVIEFYNEEEVERNKWVRKHLDEAMTQRAVFIPFYDYKDYGPQKLLIHQAKSNIIGEGLFFLFTDLDEYLTLCPKDDKEWLYRIMEKQKNRLSNNESQLYKDFPHLWQELAHFMKINRKRLLRT